MPKFLGILVMLNHITIAIASLMLMLPDPTPTTTSSEQKDIHLLPLERRQEAEQGGQEQSFQKQ